MFLNNN